MNGSESWDLEQVYDEKIAPLMTQIIAICKEHRIPVVASFAYARNADEDDTALCTTVLPFEGREVDSFVEAARAVYRRRSGIVALTITSGPAGDGKKGRGT